MKNRLERFRIALREKLPVFVFCLFLLQPVMDILSFWVSELGLSNAPTLLLRFGVLGLTLLSGFLLSRRKWVYWTAAAVCAVLTAGHVWALADFGIHDLVGDLTNLVRVLQMPLSAICLITFLRENEKSYDAMKRAMVASLLLTLAVEVLATLTGTEPHTYMDGKGYIGWFNNTNSQSAILSVLVPVAMVTAYARKGLRSLLFWLCALGGSAALYLLGTRLGYFAMAAACFGLGLSAVLIRLRDWKRAMAFVLVGVLFAALLPLSPMMQHQEIYEGVQTGRQDAINTLLDTYEPAPLDEPGLSEEELARRQKEWIRVLTPIYEFYAPDFTGLFGPRRTIEMYNYTYNINTITELRPKKLLFAQLLMEDSPASAGLFGLELSRFQVGDTIYDVENDLHGIYYLYGAAGLGSMVLFLLYFLWLILRALLKDAKTYFTLDAAAWGIGLICMLLHTYFTAGVLRRPNASFYLAAALAAVYYLVKIKRYDHGLEYHHPRL